MRKLLKIPSLLVALLFSLISGVAQACTTEWVEYEEALILEANAIFVGRLIDYENITGSKYGSWDVLTYEVD